MFELSATRARMRLPHSWLGWLSTAFGATGRAAKLRQDRPSGSVLWSQDDIEVRRVPQRWVTETLVRGYPDDALATGTQRLKAYVSGANARKATLTAGRCVSLTPVHDRLWRVQLPLQESLCGEGNPVPNNPKLRISEQPSHEVAMARFAGYPTPSTVAAITNRLTTALAGTVWCCSDAWSLIARRTLPLELPFRHVELAVPLVRISFSEPAV
jgi:hypothetical protein